MVSVIYTGSINENSKAETSPINGEILKVIVFSKTKHPNVKLTLKSVDGETLCEDYIKENKTRFYPKNAISISQEQTHIENYHVYGPLFLTIEGLGDGEVIDNIAIYFK